MTSPGPALPDRVPGTVAPYGGRYRYARWDGSQRLPDLSADEVLDALSDDLMAEGDIEEALRRLLGRGLRRRDGEPGDDLRGLDELRRGLADRRRELLKRYRLGDVLADVRDELEAVVEMERQGIERRMGGLGTVSDGDGALRQMSADVASRRQRQLDALPPDLGARLRGLQEYDFLEPAARDRFEALLGRLRGQILDSLFEGLAQSIREARPEQVAANRDMVRDLNGLLGERLGGGEPSQERVDAFLAQHGGFFPGARTLDDIVEQLAGRMAAMQSLMASMSPEQRAGFQSMMDALLRDDRLRWDLAQLAATLDQLLPDGLGQRLRFRGDEPLSLEGALAQLARIERMDRLAERLGDAGDPSVLAALDRDEVRELAGDEAAQDVAALQDLARKLEESGYLERQGERLELTARGTRRIGQHVLDELFSRLGRDAFGGHALRRSGLGGERADESIAWEFGRPFALDIQGTLANALARPENAPAARAERAPRGGSGILLSPPDFAVHQSEDLSAAATVLLLDMSRSMLLRGCSLAAKKVAVALDTLIRTRFPRDTLHVVGFAYYAREIRPGALAGLTWQGYEYGTNLQHGLLLARRLLARDHGTNKTIVVITDGEPTAHVEDGRVEFSYPPTRRTISETLKEVSRCTREGITINTFMLERTSSLQAFVERMTRLNRGRAFYSDPDRLGEYVLVDHVSRRRRAV